MLRGWFAFVALVVLLASAPASATAPPAGERVPAAPASPPDIFVNMTTQDFQFDPSEIRVPPNATVHVRVTQKDRTLHSFTVGAEPDFEIPRNWTASELTAYMVDNNLTDVAIPGTFDAVVWANFTAPAEKGRYEFVCLVPGHFQGGMFGFLIVEQPEVHVNLTTEGLEFRPSGFTVPPNALVFVRITQEDVVQHTFTVGAEPDVVLPGGWSSSQVRDYMADNNLTDVLIPGGAGVVVWANFTAPALPGRYEFVCLIPGHFQAGMVGFLTVGTGPSPPTPIQVPLIPAIMLGTIAFTLVFAAGYHLRAVRAARQAK